MQASPEKKALVTGATGFIGYHLAQKLMATGWQVHAIIRPTSNLLPLASMGKRLKLHDHDGTTESMMGILQNVQPEVVFHLASLFLASHEPKDIEPLIRSNVLFSTQLVEAMVANCIYHLINAGTSWQHHKNANYNPVCLYASTKQAFEAILRYYTEASPLKIITLKLFDTYGPLDSRPKLLNLLQEVAAQGRNLDMSPGEQLLDLVYIDDVIEAFLTAARRFETKEVRAHEIYAVSSGKPVSLKELVEIYEKVSHKPIAIKWGGRPYRPREVMTPWNRGKTLPGWHAKVTLKEGIRKLLKHYANALDR